MRCLSVAREGGVASSAFFLWCSPAGVKCRAPLIRVGEVRGPCPSVESVHESAGASGVLTSAAKRARRSLIMAASRAMARRLYSGVTLLFGCRPLVVVQTVFRFIRVLPVRPGRRRWHFQGILETSRLCRKDKTLFGSLFFFGSIWVTFFSRK